MLRERRPGWSWAMLVFLCLAAVLVVAALPVSLPINLATVRLAQATISGAADPGNDLRLRQAAETFLASRDESAPAEVWRLSGLAQLAAGNSEAARSDLQAAADRGSYLAEFALAKTALSDGDWPTAVSRMDRAGCLLYSCVSDTVNELVAKGDTGGAKGLLGAYLAAHDESALAYYRLADIAWGEGDRPSTIAALESALERDGETESVTYRYRLAWLHFLQGDNDLAVPILQQLVEEDATYFAGWYLLGQAHARLDRPDQALEAMQRAVALNPQHAWARYNLGIAMRSQGSFDGAVEQLQQATLLLPRERRFLAALADTYASMGAGCLENATRVLLEQAEGGGNPDLPRAYAEAAAACK